MNAALPMEYAMMEPVYKRMCGDPRVEFYFTSTIHPHRMKQIFEDSEESILQFCPRKPGG